MGGMNWKRPTAIKGTMHHAKTSFSTVIFAGAIISGVQYLALLRKPSHLGMAEALITQCRARGASQSYTNNKKMAS
jgi:hypothetical protein